MSRMQLRACYAVCCRGTEIAYGVIRSTTNTTTNPYPGTTLFVCVSLCVVCVCVRVTLSLAVTHYVACVMRCVGLRQRMGYAGGNRASSDSSERMRRMGRTTRMNEEFLCS
eukprot:495691-Rhodomonas_salina.2